MDAEFAEFFEKQLREKAAQRGYNAEETEDFVKSGMANWEKNKREEIAISDKNKCSSDR